MKEIIELIESAECELDDAINTLPDYNANTDTRGYIDSARNTLYVLKEEVESMKAKAEAFEKGLDLYNRKN